jgi:hypothetical protein
MGGSAVAQSHERQLFTVGQLTGDVGELTAVTDMHGGQLGPVALGVCTQPLGQ